MSARKDLIGIGGSAGGLPALRQLLERFHSTSPVSMFIVMHRINETGHLLEILQASTKLEVCEPKDGEPVRENCIYLAPPDEHLILGEHHLHRRRGPRENNFRPAIDPLFRSLAVFGQSRATGVILSGYLDDGAAGARAIVAGGGTIAVQDPGEAISPSMPRAAISAVGEPALIADAGELGSWLSGLVATEAGPGIEASKAVKLEMMIAGLEKNTVERGADGRTGPLQLSGLQRRALADRRRASRAVPLSHGPCL